MATRTTVTTESVITTLVENDQDLLREQKNGWAALGILALTAAAVAFAPRVGEVVSTIQTEVRLAREAQQIRDAQLAKLQQQEASLSAHCDEQRERADKLESELRGIRSHNRDLHNKVNQLEKELEIATDCSSDVVDYKGYGNNKVAKPVKYTKVMGGSIRSITIDPIVMYCPQEAAFQIAAFIEEHARRGLQK